METFLSKPSWHPQLVSWSSSMRRHHGWRPLWAPASGSGRWPADRRRWKNGESYGNFRCFQEMSIKLYVVFVVSTTQCKSDTIKTYDNFAKREQYSVLENATLFYRSKIVGKCQTCSIFLRGCYNLQELSEIRWRLHQCFCCEGHGFPFPHLI